MRMELFPALKCRAIILSLRDNNWDQGQTRVLSILLRI